MNLVVIPLGLPHTAHLRNIFATEAHLPFLRNRLVPKRVRMVLAQNWCIAAPHVYWGIIWALVTGQLAVHLTISPSWKILIPTLVTAWLTYRLARMSTAIICDKTQPVVNPPYSPSSESLLRRVVGWLGMIVWIAVILIWNVSCSTILVEIASEGRGLMTLLLAPWGLIGQFLLLLFFAGVLVLVEGLSQLKLHTSFKEIKDSPSPAAG